MRFRARAWPESHLPCPLTLDSIRHALPPILPQGVPRIALRHVWNMVSDSITPGVIPKLVAMFLGGGSDLRTLIALWDGWVTGTLTYGPFANT